MKILQGVLRDKLILQAEEAKEQHMDDLSDYVLHALDNTTVEDAKDESISYSYAQLKNDIQKEVWQSAIRILGYYNPESVDIEKLHEHIVICAENIIDTLENQFDLDNKISNMEPKVAGQI